jgi:hypothetical protein
MKPKRARLTKREWSIIWDCLAFVEAGEIDGGPLERDTTRAQRRALADFEAAKRKVGERL